MNWTRYLQFAYEQLGRASVDTWEDLFEGSYRALMASRELERSDIVETLTAGAIRGGVTERQVRGLLARMDRKENVVPLGDLLNPRL